MLYPYFAIFFLIVTPGQLHSYKIEKNPAALIDDAEVLMQTLQEFIKVIILKAHNQLDDLRFDILSHSVSTELAGRVSIEEGMRMYQQELQAVKDLAIAANADISSCNVEAQEENLRQLVNSYVIQMNDCLSQERLNGEIVLADGTYNADVVINTLINLDFLLDQCDPADDVCIQDIIDQANTAKIELPIVVKVAVEETTEDVTLVKVAIQDCSDTNIAGFAQEGGNLVNDVVECVNQIIQ